MTYDKKIADLFLQNFKEAYRSAELVTLSYGRIQGLIPLTYEAIVDISDDNLDKLDAFRVRFCDLQDSLGQKTFRTLLRLEEEEIGTQLDILNKMEKRKIIPSFNHWKKLRNIRNLFAHDYPEHEEQKAEAINIAFKHTEELVAILNNVIEYTKENIHFPLDANPIHLTKRS